MNDTTKGIDRLPKGDFSWKDQLVTLGFAGTAAAAFDGARTPDGSWARDRRPFVSASDRAMTTRVPVTVQALSRWQRRNIEPLPASRLPYKDVGNRRRACFHAEVSIIFDDILRRRAPPLRISGHARPNMSLDGVPSAIMMLAMNTARPRQRLLIFIVAYNAERTISQTLKRIPASLLAEYDVEVLVIDDASQDRTFETGQDVRRSPFPFKLTVLFNPVNQGYGGNQKIGFHYAITQRFDFVALLHGDGQYAPESLPQLVRPLADNTADAVFGSRMLTRNGALRGGMPLYKFVGNRVLTSIQNRLLGSRFSEFHSGYRVYSVAALRRIPFYLNTNVFHFDTEIIIQLLLSGQRVVELPIPTYYGDEICRVNGLRYAWDVLIATAKARMQQLSLFYDPKFDCLPVDRGNAHYTEKTEFISPHRLTLQKVPPGARVVDLGCAGGYIGALLKERGCRVIGADVHPLAVGVTLDQFFLHDLDDFASLRLDLSETDYVLLLDVIEHLRSPEQFVQQLKHACELAPRVQIIASTGNIGFIATRLMLLFGQMNYGKRGILDLTHTRLFTFRTFARLFEQAGFDVLEVHGIPAPFPLAVGDGVLSRLLLTVNTVLIKLRRSLFSYQMLIVARPRPSLESLLQQAQRASADRAVSSEPNRDIAYAGAHR